MKGSLMTHSIFVAPLAILSSYLMLAAALGPALSLIG